MDCILAFVGLLILVMLHHELINKIEKKYLGVQNDLHPQKKNATPALDASSEEN